jgi:hypothetical protein
MAVAESSPEEVAALLHERSGYVRAGNAARVAAVDEQLAVRGYGPDGKPLRTKPPQGRRRPARQET